MNIISFLFSILFFISLALLIVGLINPSLFAIFLKEKPSKKIIAIILSGITFLFFILAVLTTDKNIIKQKITEKVSKPKYIFDIPSLIGKDVYEVSKILGSPVDEESIKHQASLGIKEWVLTFRKNSKELDVTYKVKTRKICEYFIRLDDASGFTKDKNYLLELGNLKTGDPKYKVRFTRSLKDLSLFVGVRVIPTK